MLPERILEIYYKKLNFVRGKWLDSRDHTSSCWSNYYGLKSPGMSKETRQKVKNNLEEWDKWFVANSRAIDRHDKAVILWKNKVKVAKEEEIKAFNEHIRVRDLIWKFCGGKHKFVSWVIRKNYDKFKEKGEIE